MRTAKRLSVLTAAASAAAALAAFGLASAAGAAVRLSPLPPTIFGRLYGVSATRPTDVWAVGVTGNSSVIAGSLIQHWNGRSWSAPLDLPGYLVGVAAKYWNDAWAVGGTNSGSPSSTLIEHWNGSSWRETPSPSPGEGGYLQGVVATSRGNAWAVGAIAPGGNSVQAAYTTPLIEHWNGRRWSVQQVVVPAAGGQFRGVAATSRSDVWAVGWIGGNSDGNTQTLIEHWNGRRWRLVPSSDPAGSVTSGLASVSVVSPTNAWAVGTSSNGSTDQTLIEHWNGRTWRIVPSPTPDGDDQLNSIATVSARNAWAVGVTNPTSCSPAAACAVLIEHWNGSRWSEVSNANANPPSAVLNALWGVVSFYKHAWAVGTVENDLTLIVNYDGKTWTYQATQAP